MDNITNNTKFLMDIANAARNYKPPKTEPDNPDGITEDGAMRYATECKCPWCGSPDTEHERTDDYTTMFHEYLCKCLSCHREWGISLAPEKIWHDEISSARTTKTYTYIWDPEGTDHE